MTQDSNEFTAPQSRSITDREFADFQKLVHREAGIWLSDAKRALLMGRLNKRLRELGIDSFGEYYRYVVERPESHELVRMLDCICTNETQFFREPQHFEFLEDRVFPEWEARVAEGRRDRRVRVWSAACSTGEEPYSLAMTLLDRFPSWNIEILATDLSTRVLEQAMTGVWSAERASKVPERFLKAFMLKGARSQEGKVAAGPELRSRLKFMRLNLNQEEYPPLGVYDLIFCRNVLIYFNAESKKRVVRSLLERLIPGGYLFLGHAESLYGADSVLRVAPTIYRTAPADEERARPSAAVARILRGSSAPGGGPPRP